MSRIFTWDASDARKNIFRVEPEFTTFTTSSLTAGLMDLGQVLHEVRTENYILVLLNRASSRGKNKQNLAPLQISTETQNKQSV